jgi:hypothetical protein
MCDQAKLIETNWLDVAGSLGLMLPNFTCHKMPERFIAWVDQVRLVAEIEGRGLWLQSVRTKADRLARADVEEMA